MANNIGWGQGILNNVIDWGLGAVNNIISWGVSHKEENSWSGETEIYGTSISPLAVFYNDRVEADGGVVESLECVDNAIDTDLNWDYYVRVVSDGGKVESLECVIIE